MNKKQKILFLFLFTIISPCITAQNNKKLTRAEYIEIYKNLAIKEMKRTGIPASITLAQGILESGDGNSRLATKANNHFGIKCHDWTGKKIRHDDDKKRECFRKYESVYESYRDHSDFLTSKSRYASLFDLDPTDYKKWAKGLKKAGYATSPTYAKALITIIEENQLYLYDQDVKIKKDDIHYAREEKTGINNNKRLICEKNRIKYIVAKQSDSYKDLTEELNLLPWELAKYNELPENFNIQEGQTLYIQPKRSKASLGNNIHIVKEGETMYSISQLYGIKLTKLYWRNRMAEGTEPEIGQEIHLRKMVSKKNISIPIKTDEEKETDEEKIRFEFDPEE